MKEQIEIKITCNKYFTADFLRQLANELEERDSEDLNFDIETDYGYAEVRD